MRNILYLLVSKEFCEEKEYDDLRHACKSELLNPIPWRDSRTYEITQEIWKKNIYNCSWLACDMS